VLASHRTDGVDADYGLRFATKLLKHPPIWGTFLGLWLIASVVWWIASKFFPAAVLDGLGLVVTGAVVRSVEYIAATGVGWASRARRRTSFLESSLWVTALLAIPLLSPVIANLHSDVPDMAILFVIGIYPFRLTIVFAFAALGRFGHSVLRYQEVNAELAAVAARLEQMEARALQVRLQPAFLLQCLDAISRRMRQDSADADRLLLNVSDLLRQTLRRLQAQPVRLEEELQYLSAHYETAREIGHSPGALDFEVADGLRDAFVPSSSLEALLERLEKRCGADEATRASHLTTVRAAFSPDRESFVLSVACSGPLCPALAQIAPEPSFPLSEHLATVFRLPIHDDRDGNSVWMEVPLDFLGPTTPLFAGEGEGKS
jgi:hypothetical protein